MRAPSRLPPPSNPSHPSPAPPTHPPTLCQADGSTPCTPLGQTLPAAAAAEPPGAPRKPVRSKRPAELSADAPVRRLDFQALVGGGGGVGGQVLKVAH